MLVDNNSNPQSSLYYMGYILLKFVKNTKQFVYVDIEELYESFLRYIEIKIEFSKFLLLIDWFFMNDSIIIKKDGEIVFNVFN